MREFLLSLALPAVFAIPLLWGLFSLFRPGGARLWLTAAGCLLQTGACLLLVWQAAETGLRFQAMGGWAVPLGIALRLDGPAAAFLLLTALIASACALHGQLYLEAGLRQARYFWPLLWFLWAGLNGVWLSGDLFNLYVCLELVSLCAVGLVAYNGDAGALAAALRYLLAALAGSLAYLLGVALLFGAHHSLDLSLLGALPELGQQAEVAMALMIGGLLYKVALFPLHGWLPPAHGGAPAPVSALLSALVVKAPFYVLVRLWLELGGELGTALAANLLATLGTLAVLWGSWQAVHQSRLKMVVAYSTVAQVGYFFLFFPLAGQEGALVQQQARDGVMLMLLSHALAKSAMFLAAGNLVASLGRDSVAGLAGVARFRPLSLFSFGLAGVTLMGLPPSGAFTAKWLLLQSALVGGAWHWALVLVLGTLATAAYVFRVFRESLREGPQEDVFHAPSRWLEAAPMALAVGSVLIGLFPTGLLRVLAAIGEGS